MHGSAPWKTEETIVGLPPLLVLSAFSRFGGCHLSAPLSPFSSAVTFQLRHVRALQWLSTLSRSQFQLNSVHSSLSARSASGTETWGLSLFSLSATEVESLTLSCFRIHAAVAMRSSSATFLWPTNRQTRPTALLSTSLSPPLSSMNREPGPGLSTTPYPFGSGSEVIAR